MIRSPGRSRPVIFLLFGATGFRLAAIPRIGDEVMLVVMRHNASADEIRNVVDVIQELGYEARPIPGRQRTSIGLIGNDGQVEPTLFQSLAGVLEVIPVSHSYKQVSREWRDENTVVELPNGTRVGGAEVVLMAGPCAVESEEQILGIAESLKAMGATILRGGAFKPRSSPYSFQGLGVHGSGALGRGPGENGNGHRDRGPGRRDGRPMSPSMRTSCRSVPGTCRTIPS